MWDSVWPDPSTKAVDPVTALPVSFAGMASPSLTPLVPPLAMHSRSMSASVAVGSPGTPHHSAEAVSFTGQVRRDSNAALFGKPSSGSMSAKPGSPSSPPGSPLTSLKSPAKSLPAYRQAKKSSGSLRSNASVSSDRYDSPFNAADMPAFSAPRGPGSPLQIPTVMNRYFEDLNPPNLVFTQPTPPTGGAAASTGLGDEDDPAAGAVEPHSPGGSPPLALPPAVTSPKLATSGSPPSSNSYFPDNRATGSSSNTLQPSGRPVPPPFRRAISHVAAPSPPLLPAPTYRTRSFSGSSSQLTRPVLASRNSGSKVRTLGSAPSSPAFPAQPTLHHQENLAELERVESMTKAVATPVATAQHPSPDSELDSAAKSSASPSERTPGEAEPQAEEVDPVLAEYDNTDNMQTSQEDGYFPEGGASYSAYGDDEDVESAVLDTPLPAAAGGNDSDEVMAVPTDMLPADVAFEDEGLLTLERIFLLSKSEHAFHRCVPE